MVCHVAVMVLLCRGMTREAVRDEIRDGSNSTVFVMNVSTANAKSESATPFITRTMKENGWRKSSDQRSFHGLRGVYIKKFKNPNTGNVLQCAAKDYTKVRNLIQQGIQKYVKDAEQLAEVHAMLTQALLYDEEKIEMLEFPFADDDL